MFLLPILVVDSGPPALSSTGTLTIRVCGCDSNGAIQSCNSTAYVVSATLSPGALIALLVCVLILVGECLPVLSPSCPVPAPLHQHQMNVDTVLWAQSRLLCICLLPGSCSMGGMNLSPCWGVLVVKVPYLPQLLRAGLHKAARAEFPVPGRCDAAQQSLEGAGSLPA